MKYTLFHENREIKYISLFLGNKVIFLSTAQKDHYEVKLQTQNGRKVPIFHLERADSPLKINPLRVKYCPTLLAIEYIVIME